MGDLSPEAAALMRAGRSALRPDATDRDRVLRSLRETLGAGALVDEPGSDGPVRDAASARSPWRVARVVGGFGAIVVGTAVVLVAAPRWKTLPPPPSAAMGAAAPGAEREPSSALASDSDGANESPRAEHPSVARSISRTAARTTPESLREEVRLLSKAERQLNDGLGEDALRTLAEHERRFPHGTLAEERIATRTEALCALGRYADARNDATRLAHGYPGSAHLEAARRYCGAKLDPAP